ncbi:MAG: 23S rRNA (pseudouridine(1915)-N(3))-methyltransferase RlmH [Bacillota bacterium]
MQIKIVAVGKIKEKYLHDGLQEYRKRMGPFASLEIIEINDERIPDKASQAVKERVKDKEGEGILSSLPTGSYVIALDIQGRMFSSPELAEHLDSLALSGKSNLTFVIGGSLGLPQSVLRKADLRLSFSKMTFPHQLMRLILLEQIYRAFKISRGETYHK